MMHVLFQTAKTLAATPLMQALSKALQGGIVVLVLYILYDKIKDIGWIEVQKSMPQSPFFYISFILLYLAPPLTEWVIYQQLWGKAVKPHFPIFLKMRVYNLAVVSYMGEAYIALWGTKNLGMPARIATTSVKDSNILSALASNSLTLLLLPCLFLSGQLETMTNAHSDYGLYTGLVFCLGLILVPLVLKYQHKILSVDAQQTKHIFLLHSVRLGVTLLLQISLWSAAIPSAPLESWLLLITAQLVLTRIPFLPNTDLMFAGLGVTLLSFLEGPEIRLTSMFLTLGALSQVTNLIAYLYGQWHDLKLRVPAKAISVNT